MDIKEDSININLNTKGKRKFVVGEHEGMKSKRWEFPEFDKNDMTRWNWICQHRENFQIGKNTDIGAFTYINARYGVKISEGVKIGSHCSIYSHNTIDNTKGPVVIGIDAKIGSHCVILPGVYIGENAVIGAFSLVKENVAPNTVVYGIPAKDNRGPG